MKKMRKYLSLVMIFSSIVLLSSCNDIRIKQVSLHEMDDLFIVGEKFKEGKISLTYEDDSIELINIDSNMIKGFDTSTQGERTAIITYQNYALEYNYEVVEYYLNTIYVDEDYVDTYQIGDIYKDGDASLVLEYSDRTKSVIPITANMIQSFDTSMLGEKTLTVNYNSLKTTYDILVNSATIENVKYSEDSQNLYFVEDVFEGVSGEVTYTNGYKEIFNIKNIDEIEGFDTTEPGEKNLIFTFNGNTYQFPIDVKQKVESLTLKEDELKLIYDKNEDFYQSKVIVKYVDQTEEEILINKSDLINFDTSIPGVRKVTYQYGHKEVSFNITIPLINSIDLENQEMSSYRMEVEDESFVDLSKCVSNPNTEKFEQMPNASGKNTSNMGNVNDNLYQMSFYSLYEGTFDIQMRCQSASGKGGKSQELDKVLKITLNGEDAAMSGVAEPANTTSDWKNMENWNTTTIASSVTLKKGINRFTLLSYGTSSDVRVPNIDYFEISNVNVTK